MSGKLYRHGVGIVLFNAEGLVFIGERVDTPGAWQMPQGGIDPGESVEEAAFRELREETGTDKAEIIRIAPEKLRYDLPAEMRANLWNGKYAGQEQIWIAMRFLGTDSDININIHTPPEFRKWRWEQLSRVPDLIVPFKKEIYKRIVDIFS